MAPLQSMDFLFSPQWAINNGVNTDTNHLMGDGILVGSKWIETHLKLHRNILLLTWFWVEHIWYHPEWYWNGQNNSQFNCHSHLVIKKFVFSSSSLTRLIVVMVILNFILWLTHMKRIDYTFHGMINENYIANQ